MGGCCLWLCFVVVADHFTVGVLKRQGRFQRPKFNRISCPEVRAPFLSSSSIDPSFLNSTRQHATTAYNGITFGPQRPPMYFVHETHHRKLRVCLPSIRKPATSRHEEARQSLYHQGSSATEYPQIWRKGNDCVRTNGHDAE